MCTLCAIEPVGHHSKRQYTTRTLRARCRRKLRQRRRAIHNLHIKRAFTCAAACAPRTQCSAAQRFAPQPQPPCRATFLCRACESHLPSCALLCCALAAEVEAEEGALEIQRYKPESLDQLCALTRFSRAELKSIYCGFKQVCCAVPRHSLPIAMLCPPYLRSDFSPLTSGRLGSAANRLHSLLHLITWILSENLLFTLSDLLHLVYLITCSY